MVTSRAGIRDEVQVELNAPVTLRQRDDGTYEYPEGVKGPADFDTFEVHPNLRDAAATRKSRRRTQTRSRGAHR